MPYYRKAPKGWNTCDVKWYVPNRKRAVAYSTKAANDLIVALSQSGKTIKEVREMIQYDTDAIKVLDVYISRGYGETIARDFFK